MPLWGRVRNFSTLFGPSRGKNKNKVDLKGYCHGLTCANVWSKTWKSQPDDFKLSTRTFNMASTSGLRTRREKEQLGTEKKVWWQRGIQESVVEKSYAYLSRRENFLKSTRTRTLLRMSTRDRVPLRKAAWSCCTSQKKNGNACKHAKLRKVLLTVSNWRFRGW